MNVPGGQGSGAPNGAGDSRSAPQACDDADRAAAEPGSTATEPESAATEPESAATEPPRSGAEDADRVAARRRLAEQLRDSLLPDITDDERPDYRERGRDDLGEWLMQNRPPHHDR